LSLLGRLEDLSLPDIIQIVFLSRRTGILEIIDGRGRHTVLFHSGRIVSASSPEAPDLASFLQQKGAVAAAAIPMLRKTEESGIPFGTALLEMNLLTADQLRELVQERIVDSVTPLLSSRDGEFNFILSDSIPLVDIEYDPKILFPDGGLSPHALVGGSEGEKLKPLRGLEESMKAGRALMRGSPDKAASTAAPPGLSASSPAASTPPGAIAPAAAPGEEEPFPSASSEEPFGAATGFDELEAGEDLQSLLGEGHLLSGSSETPGPAAEATEVVTPGTKPPADDQADAREATEREERQRGRFRLGTSDQALEASARSVVVFEQSPMLRVAAKRAFGQRGMRIFQFTTLDDTRAEVAELLRQNHFFITFLDLTSNAEGASEQLLAAIKKKNHRLPVVVIDRAADLRRRARLLRGGADHYLTKPSEAHLQPALADEQLALFADELVNFAERSFSAFEAMASGEDGARRLYDMAEQEKIARGHAVLKQLINEVSNPNDISELAQTILRLAGEYVDRAALFVLRDRQFVAHGAVSTREGEALGERLGSLAISISEGSILSEVAARGEKHRGKIRRLPANERLINALGNGLPTEIVVLPILHSGSVVGLLYGDNAEQHEPMDELSGLEVFISQAGFALQNAVVAAERGGRG
jgi:CheY-like chemotaxis protein